jgi:hypothetical protein
MGGTFDYSLQDSSWFSSILTDKCRDNTLKSVTISSTYITVNSLCNTFMVSMLVDGISEKYSTINDCIFIYHIQYDMFRCL